ncbi:MAG TPA: exodeoxyribonuclease III [Candidatus Nanoarchaeia archaeon]|nr:exodeoxyribonuclease III [Candidatus Nanoarchaeia archaeon]
MKLISWNVNGIRAILNKGFLDFVQKENPDVLSLQETKASQDQVDSKLFDYPFHYWNSAQKKGYSGTAVFSKVKPLSVTYDLGIPEHDQEGRVITLEFPDFFLINSYVPNSGRELVRLNYRNKWDRDFLAYWKKLEQKKPVIVCGDLNVAHTDIDLENPKSNYNKSAGYTQIEIDGFTNFLKSGYVDSFRKFNQESNNYTYWSYMFNARSKNVGWRIDYFLVSRVYQHKLVKAFILPEVMGSDHCPVGIVLK